LTFELEFLPSKALPDYSNICKQGQSTADRVLRLLINIRLWQGILKGKYHCTVDLLFDWFGFVLQIKTKIVSCFTANSKPIKQEVNGTVILPPLVFHD
jgi:hypothetical protein